MGPSDYALRVLREVIDHRGLFLAWNDGKIVGITNFEECVDGSGWLSMARTHPAWRRQGVAVFLQKKIAVYAKRKGIPVLRLWALSENKPSISACKKGGFRQVCEAVHISYRLRRLNRGRCIRPASPAAEIPLKSLLRSSYLSKMNGYIAYRWRFIKPTTKLLQRLQRRRELYMVGDSTFLLTKPERMFRGQQSGLTILGGPVRKTLQSAKEIAKGSGAQILSSYLPYDPYQLAVAADLGFKTPPWGRRCLVFEKPT